MYLCINYEEHGMHNTNVYVYMYVNSVTSLMHCCRAIGETSLMHCHAQYKCIHVRK